MKKYIQILFAVAIFMAVAPVRSAAQLVSLFTQYSDLQTFINPAAIPSEFLQYQQKSVAGLTFRRQWTKIEGSPLTALARFDHTNQGNTLSSFGGFLMKDKVGAADVQGIYGRYAYQIRPSSQEDMFIGLGLTAGMLQYRIDRADLEFKPGDQLQAAQETKWVPDFGIGINFIAYPQRGAKFYAGVSLPQVAGLGATFDGQDGEKFTFRRPTHVMGSMGAIFPVGQQGFMEPSIWVKYTKNQPVNVDINLRQKFRNNFWMGLGYGTAKVIHTEVGLILAESIGLQKGIFRIGYGFDYNISGLLSNYLGTTHEINLSYAFGSTKQ